MALITMHTIFLSHFPLHTVHILATDEQNFKDGSFLYRFTADDGHEGAKDYQRRLTGSTSRIDFNNVSVSTCRTITVSA